jgi:hypothetical protein
MPTVTVRGFANVKDALDALREAEWAQFKREIGAPADLPLYDWRCPDCGCQTYARVDERKPDGSFGPGPQIRCVSCKRTYDKPVQ